MPAEANEGLSLPEERFAFRVQTLANFRTEIASTEFPEEIEAQKSVMFQLADRLRTDVLPQIFGKEISHFFVEGQTTTGSQHKSAEVEGIRTINSILADLILTPKSESEIALSENDVRYRMFTYLQTNKEKRLTLEQFQDFQRTMLKSSGSDESFAGLVTMHAVHDLCKLTSVATYVKQMAGVETLNHDKLQTELLMRPELYKQIAPAFDELPEEYKYKLFKTVKSGFSRAQVLQAEASAAQFRALFGMDENDLDLLESEHLGDTSGVIGTPGAIGLIMDSDFYIASKCTHEAEILYAIQGKSEYASYNHILQFWLDHAETGIQLTEEDYFNPEGREKITLARFLCVLKGDNRTWKLINHIYSNLFNQEMRTNLVGVFGRHGVSAEDFAVMFYYFPDTMRELPKKFATKGNDAGYNHGVENAMRLFAEASAHALRFFTLTKKTLLNPKEAAKLLFTQDDIRLFAELLGDPSISDDTPIGTILSRGWNVDENVNEFQFTLFEILQQIRKPMAVHLLASYFEARITQN